MFQGFSLFPEQASTIGARVDLLFYFLSAVSAFFTALIFTLVLFLAIKYRRGAKADRTGPGVPHSLEKVFIGVPFVIVMVIFFWASSLYFSISRPPAGAIEVFVTGRQWMWKFQHPTGQREINELHVPLGRAVRLTMISEDTIHSFFVPAFRVKADVLPGRYTGVWFEATKIGEYHLFCAEYCGTKHSGMIGRVVVMEPSRYEEWLAAGVGSGESPVAAGEALFQRYGCAGCHKAGAQPQCPLLVGLYGKQVQLSSGETVLADDQYLRESILQPQAKLVAGYQPVMPTFQNLLGETQIQQILAYIKSLKKTEGGQTP
jgi:cytochrome c oxidase subunit II